MDLWTLPEGANFCLPHQVVFRPLFTYSKHLSAHKTFRKQYDYHRPGKRLLFVSLYHNKVLSRTMAISCSVDCYSNVNVKIQCGTSLVTTPTPHSLVFSSCKGNNKPHG